MLAERDDRCSDMWHQPEVEGPRDRERVKSSKVRPIDPTFRLRLYPDGPRHGGPWGTPPRRSTGWQDIPFTSGSDCMVVWLVSSPSLPRVRGGSRNRTGKGGERMHVYALVLVVPVGALAQWLLRRRRGKKS